MKKGEAAPLRPRAPVRGSDQLASLCALGDLILTGEWESEISKGGASKAFGPLGDLFKDQDLVFANLETTIQGNDPRISKQPRLITEPKTIEGALTAIGVDVVNLSNNHAFDANWGGFESVQRILEKKGIESFGAGRNLAEAARPRLIECRGIRLGWLGYTALDTKPSHVANSEDFGVNPLVQERAFCDVRDLNSRVDHVVVSLHWGVEYCHVPSPSQIQFARSLVDCGATLIIGHHTHVIQGIETYKAGLIAYSLGNATTTDLYIDCRRAIRQTPRTRSSIVLRTVFSRNRIEEFEAIPIRAELGRVVTDDAHASRILKKANRRLHRGISPLRWKTRRFVEDVILRTIWKLDPRVIRSLRVGHIATFFRNLGGALSGRGPQ